MVGPMLPIGACPPPQGGEEKQSTVTRSLIENLTEDKVVVQATKDWSGRAIGGYRTIEKGKRSGFHHKGKNDDSNGSKGAVVYAGKASNKDVAFLLAWHSSPYAGANNKVYTYMCVYIYAYLYVCVRLYMCVSIPLPM